MVLVVYKSYAPFSEGENLTLTLFFYCSEKHSYLTWRDMSTQGGILSKFHSSKLWTRPSKDQYLLAYFKQVCDEYMASENPHRVFPVEVGSSKY